MINIVLTYIFASMDFFSTFEESIGRKKKGK